MRGRLAAGVLAVLAVVSAVVAVRPALTGSEGSEPGPAATTPVFSLRRVPGLVTRTVAATRLSSELDGLLAESLAADARDDTCLAVQDPDGRGIYGREAGKPLIPASAMKVLTGAVTLAKLGADSRYVTPVRAAAAPQDGSVGDLWLVGSGDPFLATADFAATAGWLEYPRPATSIEALADRIAGAGVRRVGRLLGDESRYDTQRYLPTWAPTYAANGDVGPQSALTVNDGYSQWRPSWIVASSPASHGATVLATLLRSRGVTVGGVGEGRAPDPAVTVAQIESPPLADVVGVMLQHSGNLAAELMVKELGVRFGGGGTTASGVGVLRATAAELGLPVDALAASDGSGLDRSDRLSCELLQRVLVRDGSGGPVAKGLPVSGSSGTLVRRFLGTPAVGRVRAKTGSLSGVAALTGWAAGVDGRDISFSLLANDLPSEAAGMALQNQLATVLAGYPRAPAPQDIAPETPKMKPG